MYGLESITTEDPESQVIECRQICRDCSEEKDLTEFPKHPQMRLGVNSFCKACNVLRVKKWRLSGKRDCAEESRRHYARHTEKRRAFFAARRKQVKRATPPWADLNEIEAIYLNRPEGFHVDHIVPLNGKTVCGLHVPWNLQYLPSKDNLMKSNKW